MKHTIFTNSRTKRTISVMSIMFLLLLGTILLLSKTENGRASNSEPAQIYIPLVQSNARQAPVPSLVASIPLVDAQCPHDMTYNKTSDLLYITNEKSNNLSVIRNQSHVSNIATGKWPIYVESDPLSDKVYVSHVWDGISILNGFNVTDHIPEYGESYYIVVNATNGYAYITDLHHPITVIDGQEKVVDLFVPDFEGHVIEWQVTADYDRLTGLTYFPSWRYGAMTVVDGTKVVDQFPFFGEGAGDMVIDSHRKLAFVANNRAFDDKESPNNISIVDLKNKGVTSIISAKYSQHVALDQVMGYVYVTNPKNNNVTVLQGKREVATYPTGKKPWGVAVDSMTGLAYVTNADDNSISVFRNGVPVTTIQLPKDKGFEPYQVTIDEETGRVFILNRSSEEDPTYPERQVTICRQPWVHILQ